MQKGPTAGRPKVARKAGTARARAVTPVAPSGSSTASIDLAIDARELMELARTLLRTIHDALELTRAEVAAQSGLSDSSVSGMMHRSRNKKTLSINELRTLVAYGRKVADGSHKDENLQRTVSDLCTKIMVQAQAALYPGEISVTEYAFVSHLGLSPQKQALFSERHAGVYAIMRFTTDGTFVMSRMDLHPKQPGGVVCRFVTRRVVGSLHEEQVVEGYTYFSDNYIYAIGRATGSGTLRSTILSVVPKEDPKAPVDMVGLRLSNSPLDGGPFGQRLYCRKIGTAGQLTAPFSNWSPWFRPCELTGEALTEVRKLLPDIDNIVTLLKESDKVSTPWGLKLPRGRLN